MKIFIIISIIFVIILSLQKYFKPFIDIIIEDRKYKIVLWYYKYHNQEKIRTYIHLFTI